MKTMMRAGVLGLVAATGCATIMAGGPDVVPIATNPPNANVFVDGTFVGRTPMSISLDRRAPNKVIQIALDGFQPVSVTRIKRINNWVWGNLFWGLFPIVIDVVTGDYQTYGDEPIAIGLTPMGPGGPPPPNAGGMPPGPIGPGDPPPPNSPPGY